MTKEFMIAEITEILAKQSWWIINQIYRFSVNMTKEGTTKIAIIYEKPQLKAIFENIVKKYAMCYCA